MRYGHAVTSVKPEALKQMIQNRIENLLHHYQNYKLEKRGVYAPLFCMD